MVLQYVDGSIHPVPTGEAVRKAAAEWRRSAMTAKAKASLTALAASGIGQAALTVMKCDAQNVLTISSNLVSSKNTRHITRRELIVREREIEGHLRLEKVGTDDNLADMFTKVLDRAPFEKFRRLVMNVLLNGIQYLAPRGKRPRSEG